MSYEYYAMQTQKKRGMPLGFILFSILFHAGFFTLAWVMPQQNRPPVVTTTEAAVIEFAPLPEGEQTQTNKVAVDVPIAEAKEPVQETIALPPPIQEEIQAPAAPKPIVAKVSKPKKASKPKAEKKIAKTLPQKEKSEKASEVEEKIPVPEPVVVAPPEEELAKEEAPKEDLFNEEKEDLPLPLADVENPVNEMAETPVSAAPVVAAPVTELPKKQVIREGPKNISGAAAMTNVRAGVPGGVRHVSELKPMPGNLPPSYDYRDRVQKKEGLIAFQAYVDRSGNLSQFKLMKSTGHQSLDLKTLKTLKKWRFSPGQEGWVEIPFRWSLQGQPQLQPSLRRQALN